MILVTFLQSSLLSFCVVFGFGMTLVSLLIWSEAREQGEEKE